MKVPYGSRAYQLATQRQIDAVSNGCGRYGRIMALNMIAGVKVEDACDAHDFEYRVQVVDRLQADVFFLDNMLYLIDKAKLGRIKKASATTLAWLYYYAVRIFARYP